MLSHEVKQITLNLAIKNTCKHVSTEEGMTFIKPQKIMCL